MPCNVHSCIIVALEHIGIARISIVVEWHLQSAVWWGSHLVRYQVNGTTYLMYSTPALNTPDIYLSP